MKLPLGNRLDEAESQQTQAECEVAAQFDAIRRELSLENDAMNTPLDEVRNMKHLIKAATYRDWCDLRQNGAFSDWDCDKLARVLGKHKPAAPAIDDNDIKQQRVADTCDLIKFAQKMIDSKRPFSAQNELFRIVGARVHPDMAQVARAERDFTCELAWIKFEYNNGDRSVADAPVNGTVYIELVNKDTLQFYMNCENEPKRAKFNRHPTYDNDSVSNDGNYSDWGIDIQVSAGERLSNLDYRHTIAANSCPLYAHDIRGRGSIPRWPCSLLSMLVYTSRAMNPMTDRTSERIRKSDFRDVATILKPFFDIDANPDTFIYPFFKSLISSEFYDLIRPLYDKSLFYISD